MRICRDDAYVPPAVGDAGIFLFLFQPGELARQLLALRLGHAEFEQEAAGSDVAAASIAVLVLTMAEPPTVAAGSAGPISTGVSATTPSGGDADFSAVAGTTVEATLRDWRSWELTRKNRWNFNLKLGFPY